MSDNITNTNTNINTTGDHEEEGWECCEGCQQYFDTRTESTERCGRVEYGYYHASCWFHHDECRECKYHCYEEEDEKCEKCGGTHCLNDDDPCDETCPEKCCNKAESVAEHEKAGAEFVAYLEAKGK